MAHAQPRHDVALTDESIAGAVFGITVVAAELLFREPVAEARLLLLRLGFAANRGFDGGEQCAYVVRAVGRDVRFAREVSDAVVELRHICSVQIAVVGDGDIRRGHQHGGVDVYTPQLIFLRVSGADERLENLGVSGAAWRAGNGKADCLADTTLRR